MRLDWEKGAFNNMFNGPRLGLIYLPTEKLVVKYCLTGSAKHRRERKIRNPVAGLQTRPETLTAHELVTDYTVGDKLSVNTRCSTSF